MINIKKHKLFIISMIISAIMTFCILAWLCKRIHSVYQINKQAEIFITNLKNLGYDISYEKFSTSYIPFISLAEFKKLQIYNIYNEKEYISLGNAYINNVLFSRPSLYVSFEGAQLISFDGLKNNITLDNIYLKNDNLISLKNFKINNILEVKQISFTKTGESKNEISIDNISIDDSISMPMIRNIEKILVSYSMNQNFNMENNSNKISIDKFIIKWEPLLMVGKGSLFISNQSPLLLKTNTTSKGLVEALEMLDQDKLIDYAGFEVAKTMLNDQSYMLNSEDKYHTVTTSINIRNNQLFIGNISVYEF